MRWLILSELPCLFLFIPLRVDRYTASRGACQASTTEYLRTILPLNYWLEYLDLVFFYKCMKGHIIFGQLFDEYFSFLRGWSRRTSTELYLKTNRARTSHFRDYFFDRITILWNSLPEDIKLATSLDSFKRKLKSLFFWRLHNIFIGDNIRSNKIICPKCRRVSIRIACSC